jgi:Cu+-exporting ATPase
LALESLHTLNKNIKYSQVNFTRKTLQISFNHNDLKLSELANFLTNLGYKPVISLETADKNVENLTNLTCKICHCGFCFRKRDVPCFSEYVGGEDYWMEHYKGLFRALMCLWQFLLYYSASDYYKSAWYGLKNKIVNIDVPIVLGIIVLFGRSLYEVATITVPDILILYADFCSSCFWVKSFRKERTTLSYDRDYKSFYPIAVTKLILKENRKIFCFLKLKWATEFWLEIRKLFR